MVHTDRSALICDLAETYGIYDMGSLPVTTVAILASGLRDNSRIKMKLAGMKVSNELLLSASSLPSSRYSKITSANIQYFCLMMSLAN